jgi:hypothetical protein
MRREFAIAFDRRRLARHVMPQRMAYIHLHIVRMNKSAMAGFAILPRATMA